MLILLKYYVNINVLALDEPELNELLVTFKDTKLLSKNGFVV